MHLQDAGGRSIPDVAYGIYYFELQVDPAATVLQGEMVEIPIAFSAENAPDGFAIPPARLAVRDAGGGVPFHLSGTSTDLLLQDTLEPDVSVNGLRLLTAAQVEILRQLILSDTAVIPNTDYAAQYFDALTTTLPHTVDGGQLSVADPAPALPWVEAADSPVYVVARQTISTTLAVRRPVNDDTQLHSVDDFGLPWQVDAPRLYLDGRSDYGAAWAVTADLAPGATLTLRPGDAYYAPDRTHLPSAWSPGLLLYAQVDSYAPGMPHGAIPEQDELNGNDYNNILGPVPLP